MSTHENEKRDINVKYAQLNFSVLGGGGNGGIQTEVLDEDFMVIEGFSRSEADILKGDGIRLEQMWNHGASAIDSLSGKKIRLKFYMNDVDLYSFCSSE